MSAIKTAISIDEHLFHRVEEMSEKYHISKSQIFSQAIQYMIRKDEGIELVNKINKSLKNISQDDINYHVTNNYKKIYNKNIEEKW